MDFVPELPKRSASYRRIHANTTHNINVIVNILHWCGRSLSELPHVVWESYPMLSETCFEIDDVLLHMLGVRYEFKRFHLKMQGRRSFHSHAYFGEEVDDIVGSSLLH